MSRRVELEGPANFRDIGGYATRDGASVRVGRVYRSDSLSYMTDADVQYKILRGNAIRMLGLDIT